MRENVAFSEILSKDLALPKPPAYSSRPSEVVTPQKTVLQGFKTHHFQVIRTKSWGEF